jgi:hypothetical protein
VIVVGLVSSYREGRLLRGCLDSIERVGLDKLYVYEGPAGAPLDADVPESDFDKRGPTIVHHGRWRTDARKRQAMLDHVHRDYHDQPVWGIVLDGDEILVNGEYLRDILQARLWDDEANPDKPPWARWPLRKIEHDGSVGLAGGRCIRLDFVKEYLVSNATLTNVWGFRDGWGDVIETNPVWLDMFLKAIDGGRMAAWPPFPCEPHIFHRSNLRHPLRRGLRLHMQEAVELAKLDP